MDNQVKIPTCSMCKGHNPTTNICKFGAGSTIPYDPHCQAYEPLATLAEIIEKANTKARKEYRWYTEAQVNPLAKRHYNTEEN